MRPFSILACLLTLLVGCQTFKPAPYSQTQGQVRTDSKATNISTRLDAPGEFDNHEQVIASVPEKPSAPTPAPHIVVKVTATDNSDWTLWQIRLEAATPIEATWAMQSHDGAWIPHRALSAAALSSKFDPKQWAALDGCALHGDASGRAASANPDSCAPLATTLGVTAALLPLAIERDGEWLHVRLFADQARGPGAREDARETIAFGGWAAINGAGPNAVADSTDWHMDRDVRIGSEGGRYALVWRDGKRSGYSLLLERMTYRNGPVLKLALSEDASGRTLAYAWANPEATRIGLNIGWVQVGLERGGVAHAAPGDIR